MDAEIRGFLDSLEGRDARGNSNAVCGIHIFSVGEEPPVEVRGHSCLDAEVAFHIVTGGISEMDFIFADREDGDFIKVVSVCHEFDERMQEGEDCVINLVVTHGGDYGRYISAMCRSWAHDVPDSQVVSSAVRFFVETDQIFEVSLPGEAMGGAVDPMGSGLDADWIG